MQLKYELRREEIEETLLCLDWKKEGKKKYINMGIMAVIAVLCLEGYWRDRENPVLFLLAALTVVLMFCVLYIPRMRRGRSAKKMAGGKNQHYEVTLPPDGMRAGFDSENVFTIQTGQEVYCIPKRILEEKACDEIRQIMADNDIKVYKVITGKEQKV